jgi:Holliday junction DNA helicase RuvA
LIGRLCGKILSDEPGGTLVLDVHGVGYELMAPVGTAGRAQTEGDAIVLWVHTHVREDALDLFGFASELERRVFRMLIEVPNVGPRTALNLLSALPTGELGGAVHAGDVARLCRVPGIGKKTAERLVLELKEKLPKLTDRARPAAEPARGRPDDAQRLAGALTNMGYRAAEAERAVKSLGDRVGREPLAELLREALAHLTPT